MFTLNKLNILTAYPYLDKEIIRILNQNQDRIRFVLDSGAFTAWKTGKKIGLDDYCKFIENLPFRPWRYFVLDDVGNPEMTLKNYEVMLERGFKPVPIFTRGEDIKMIDKYYETSDIVGIGGLVGTSGNKGFVKWIMNTVGKRKVHWLGFTNFDFIKFYRPYMCDSSSWESGARYGQIKLYTGNGRFITCEKSNFKLKPDPDLIRKISDYGFNPSDFAKEESWYGTWSKIRSICARSAVKYSMDVENKLGTKQFIAVSGRVGISLLLEGL